MANVIDANRLADITNQLYGACVSLTGDLDTVKAAKDAKDAASETATGTRERIMLTVADLAAKGAWEPFETKIAIKNAGARMNNIETKGSLAVFISECSHAAHPAIRGRIDAVLKLRNDAWDAETEASIVTQGEAPTPIKKAFKRRYHALIGIMSAIEKGENLSTVEDVVSYAVAHDPDHDAAKVLKRLKGLVSDLSDFYGDFPVDDIGHAIQTLQNVTADILTAARNAKIAENKALCASSAAAATPTVTAPKAAQTVVNKPTIVPTQPKVASKASAFQVNTVQVDAVGDLLGDNLESVAA